MTHLQQGILVHKIAGFFFPAVFVLGVVCCRDSKYLPETQSGKILAEKHCASCHIFPEPSLLPSENWPEVLNAMAPFLGRKQAKPTTSVWDNSPMVKSTPVVNDDEWEHLKQFYIRNSPQTPPAERALPPACSLKFKAMPLPYPAKDTFITYLKIDPISKRIQFSDINNRRLFEYDFSGKALKSLPAGAAITEQIRFGTNEYYLGIGNVYSFQDPKGYIFQRSSDRLNPIVSDLLRPASAVTWRDTNGTPVFFVADFGLAEGQLYSYESDFKNPKKIINRPGVVSLTKTRDNRIFFLSSQAVERISELKYENGSWVEYVHVEYPPSYGGSSIRAVDLDNDGVDEIIVTHGDNGDFVSMPLRPYHGIRVYKLEPGKKLEMTFFYPMYGAYKMAIADFDRDGYPDIAATAYFYDKKSANPQKMVMLISQKGKAYSACTLTAAHQGRWMAIDAEDINGDGLPDLILGGAYFANFEMGNADGLADPKKRAALLILRSELNGQ